MWLLLGRDVCQLAHETKFHGHEKLVHVIRNELAMNLNKCP